MSLREVEEAEIIKVADFYISMADLEHRYWSDYYLILANLFSGIRNAIVVTLAIIVDIVLHEKKYVSLRTKIEGVTVSNLTRVMDTTESLFRKVLLLLYLARF